MTDIHVIVREQVAAGQKGSICLHSGQKHQNDSGGR